jgi:hypothetical protein
MLTLIQTAKLNDVDPQAWLADVLAAHRRSQNQRSRRAAAMELATPHPDRTRRLTRLARLAGAHLHSRQKPSMRSLCGPVIELASPSRR